MRFRAFVILLILAVLVFPLALAAQVGLDTRLGDGAFLDTLMNGRHRVLAMTLMEDWLAAAPMIAAVMACLVLLAFAGRGGGTLRWIYRLFLLAMLVSPLLPMVPVMMGLVLALSAVLAGLWSWGALA